MSESERAGQDSLEQTQELVSDDTELPTIRTSYQSARPGNAHHNLSIIPTAIKDIAPPGQRQTTSSATNNAHRDLNQIIARAREEIRHLREELARHEAQIASVARERDEIQQQYTQLYDNFIEAVHFAAEEEIRQTARSLRATPGRIPKLLAPVQESIASWSAEQQAEQEAILRQKLETAHQQAAIIRQELIHERESLDAEREQFTQQRQTFSEHMKTRETWLQNRWLVKAWGTAAVMFLVLPALQVYLLIQKTSIWNIIIIPTTICLVLTALINLARSRKKPPQKKSAA